ncbi:MAG TPA: thiazolylpeptide-type bacteriocin [Pyrinomonadaceae bacterium]|jgi:thiazolylpeptide-type bacteriocin precursor
MDNKTLTNELQKLDVESFEIEDINDLSIDAPQEELAMSGDCCSCCSCCSSCCS